jgi:hypothetical protein
LRRMFHRYELTLWMPDRECQRELLVLAAGGERYADVLYDQPTERMMGQIQAAANLALEYPDRYRRMYDFFTNEEMQMSGLRSQDGQNDSATWENFVTHMVNDGAAIDTQQRIIQERDGRLAQQARVRLGNLIARRLDMFQNRTQYRWARYNQAASIVTGVALTAYALLSTMDFKSSQDIVVLLCSSFLAGMLAPFAKDVVSAITGIRVRV